MQKIHNKTVLLNGAPLNVLEVDLLRIMTINVTQLINLHNYLNILLTFVRNFVPNLAGSAYNGSKQKFMFSLTTWFFLHCPNFMCLSVII